jgi:hypothetical protein
MQWVLVDVGGDRHGPSDTARIYVSCFTYFDDLDVTSMVGLLHNLTRCSSLWRILDCITFNDDSLYEAWYTWEKFRYSDLFDIHPNPGGF